MRFNRLRLSGAAPALMVFLLVLACSRNDEGTPPVAAPEEAQEELIVIEATDDRLAEPPSPEVDPVESARIVEKAFDTINEDPTEQPNEDLPENPRDSSDYTSPHPDPNSTTSAVGLGGGIGGGGGSGGFDYRRARGGGGAPRVQEVHGRTKADWPRDHQSSEGYWSASDYDDDSSRDGATRTENIEFVKPGDPEGDSGNGNHDLYVTSLALLNYASEGYDHKVGDFRSTCRRAIRYVMKMQGDNGCFGEVGDGHVRVHAVATQAMAEIYGLSGDQVLKPITERAVEYLVSQQIDGSGWGDDNEADVITTANAAIALKVVDLTGISFDSDAVYKGVHTFLDAVKTERDGRPFVSFSESRESVPRPKGNKASESLPLSESAWMVTALFTEHRSATDEDVKALSEVLVRQENLPAWEESKLDFLYWNFASLALYQVGGKAWDTWEKAVSATLHDHQRGSHETDKANGHTSADTLAEHGSWDAVDCWSIYYGRVYSTAINSLTLQVYYRYLRVSETSKDSDGDGLPDVSDFMKAHTDSRRAHCGSLLACDGGTVVGGFPLKRTEVSAKVSGTVAGTTVTQTFTNPFHRVIEARYTFPLPNDSAINDFVMEANGRRIVGVIRPKEEARRVYREALASGRTATLLTQKRPNVFNQSVANIAVGGDVKVKITYYQNLPYVNGRFEYVFPMTLGQRYHSSNSGTSREGATTASKGDGLADSHPHAGGAEPVRVRSLLPGMRSGMDVKLEVEIDAGMPIDLSSLGAAAHEVVAQVHEDDHVTVSLARHDAIPNRDFVLRWSLHGDEPGVGLLTHRGEHGRFFQLHMHPQLDPADVDITPREITFIMDVSGSMSGEPSRISRELIGKVLARLHPDDRFNIVKFASGNDQLFDSPATNVPANIEKANEFLSRADVGGGTEMLAGLERALAAKHDPRYLQMFCFLSDGFISGENYVFKTIRHQGKDARFFSFGIGAAPNRHLLDGIAGQGKGKAVYCQRVGGKYNRDAVNEFFEAIDSPVLCDIDIDWNGVAVTDISPARVTDLFAGHPLVVRGRSKVGGAHTIYVRGRVGANYVEYPLKLDFDNAGNHPAVPVIWARNRVAELESEMLDDQEDPRLIQEITDTALKFNLMSRFTSFTAVDETTIVGDGAPLQVWQRTEMPEGVTFHGDDRATGDTAFHVKAWGLWLGQTADGRVVVVKVADGSGAANTGMRPGQIITSIEGVKVTGLAQCEQLLLQSPGRLRLETRLNDRGRAHDAEFEMPAVSGEEG